MSALAVERPILRCPRCSQAVAIRDGHDWQPLGARVKRLPGDNRPSFVCPICGAAKRIPSDPDSQHRPEDPVDESANLP